MRRRVVIIGLVVVLLGALPAWRWTARKQWITQSTRELQQRGAPPAELMKRIQSGGWTGRDFLVFSNGWASLTYHTFHQSMSIGDIALMLTSEGDLYRSDFHFCLGSQEFDQERQSRPTDISQFLQIYGSKHHWKKI